MILVKEGETMTIMQWLLQQIGRHGAEAGAVSIHLIDSIQKSSLTWYSMSFGNLKVCAQ